MTLPLSTDHQPVTTAAPGRKPRRRLPTAWPIVVGLIVALGARPAPAAEIGPESDFCAEANALAPGTELVLRPGDYQGPCTIRTGGLPGAPIVVRALDPTQRPRIVFEGTRANVISVRASHVVLRGLEIGPTQHGVDAVRVFGGTDVTVEDCEFRGLGGIAVVANHASVRGLVVRGNVMLGASTTAMYFGCHDGAGCVVSGLLVERNYIHTVRAPEPSIGYGIQVKLNSSGIIRDNVIADIKGPGIMVYGAYDPTAVSFVERNFVVGSLRSAGLVVGGGPVAVRNNVSVGNVESGISVEDYGRRGLLRGVVIAHNTTYGNRGGGIVVPDAGARDVAVVNNAVHGRSGGPQLPSPETPGVRLAGNVDCTWAPCFVDPEVNDFSPAMAGKLAGLAAVRAERWIPTDDFFAVPRALPATVGAVERPAPAIHLGRKP
jgi:hypothetical protein